MTRPTTWPPNTNSISTVPDSGSPPALVASQLVDEEVRHLIEAAHEEVTQLMSADRNMLDALARALPEHETLEQDEAYAAGIEPLRTPVGLDATE